MPIWLRNTPEYLKNDGARSITLLSNAQSRPEVTAYHDEYDLKFNSSPELAVNSKFNPINDQVISKKQMNSTKIEQELAGIEAQWRQKYQVKKAVEPGADPLQKHSIFKHANVRETQQYPCVDNKENLVIGEETQTSEGGDVGNLEADKFLQSTRIHTKPTSLFHLGLMLFLLYRYVS